MQFLNIFKSLICFSISSFFAIALLSYNYTDPSLNRVTNVEPENLLGITGSYVSEPLLQLFGLAAFLFTIIPLCWALVYYHYGKISLLFSRIIAGVIAINAGSLVFYDFTIKNHFFSNGLGGAIGLLLNKFLTQYFAHFEFYPAAILLLIISLYFCLGLSNELWNKVGSITAKFFIKFFKMIIWPFKKIPIKSTIKEEVIEKKIPLQKKKISPIINSAREKVIDEALQMHTEPKIVAKAKTISKVSQSYSDGFTLPSTDLLKDFPVNKENLQKNAAVIEQHTEELSQILADFGVNGEMLGASAGPVVTLFEFEPAAGTKSSRVIGLADDIARSMRAISTRIAVIPGRNAIGIELPNKQRETVYLKELLESAEYQDKEYDLPIILGKDISGNVIVADLARMPHLLVAGTTGSGKSVAINTMILSLVYALTPDQCKFIMVDPKMLELSVYDGIPHLLTNVVTEPGKAIVALKWVVKEMENRYRLMSNLSVRNIHNYNERIKEAVAKGEVIQRNVHTGFDSETGKPKIEQVAMDMKTLPFIVVIVDEMADLMLVAGKEIETSIQRLAQMARAAGIHIIMATQRPSVDVITGVIKANFPTRISFQVTSKIDSRTILGEQGAEQLLGKGDMLYMAGGSKITRIHGPFIADDEVERIVSYLKSQGSPEYMADITAGDGEDSSGYNSGGYSSGSKDGEDELYKQAIEIIQAEGKVSISFVQRYLKIGYNRAANIIEQMERDGLVSKANSMGKREILM